MGKGRIGNFVSNPCNPRDPRSIRLLGGGSAATRAISETGKGKAGTTADIADVKEKNRKFVSYPWNPRNPRFRKNRKSKMLLRRRSGGVERLGGDDRGGGVFLFVLRPPFRPERHWAGCNCRRGRRRRGFFLRRTGRSQNKGTGQQHRDCYFFHLIKSDQMYYREFRKLHEKHLGKSTDCRMGEKGTADYTDCTAGVGDDE